MASDDLNVALVADGLVGRDAGVQLLQPRLAQAGFDKGQGEMHSPVFFGGLGFLGHGAIMRAWVHHGAFGHDGNPKAASLRPQAVDPV
jgi:hypothetical protein